MNKLKLTIPSFRFSFPGSSYSPAIKCRARAAVGIGFVLICLAQLVMGLAVETVKPEWRDPEYGHRWHQLRRLRDEYPGRPLVVAVGSSRTLMGLSPLAMGFGDEAGSPLVYNFGQTGAGPLQILLTTFRFLDAGVKPQFLLVELYPAALVGDGSAEEMMKPWGPRLGLGDVRRLGPYAADPTAIGRLWAENRVAPWYSLRLVLMNHWRPSWLPMSNRIDFQWDRLDPRGWLSHPHTTLPESERVKNIAQARPTFARQFDGYTIGKTSDRALRDIVARCRAEGIRVAFYLTPEGPAFTSWYPPGVKHTIAGYIDSLRHECGVPIFNAADGFGEDEFADSHHLLPGGAVRFSRRLADEYVRGWAKNGR